MSAPRHAGASVFLVEDEVMIRMMVADMLGELGYRIAAEAGDVPEALKLARTTEFDLALLDVNLGGHVITPVAKRSKCATGPLSSPLAMIPPVFPKSFESIPPCRSHFRSTCWPERLTTC